MDKFGSFDDYMKIVSEYTSSSSVYVSNCYLLKTSISRLIMVGRLYYEKYENGLVIYDDEVDYYQCYVFGNLEDQLLIPDNGKLNVFMFVYSENDESVDTSQMKHFLDVNGFFMDARLYQIIGNVDRIMENLSPEYEYAEEIFRDKGYLIEAPSLSNISEMRKVIASLETIPFYQFPYATDDEIIKEGKAGKHYCVLDKNGKVVAVAGSNADRGGPRYIGILKSHRLLSGIAPVLTMKNLMNLKDNKNIVKGWVDENNIASLMYHKSLGYRTTTTRMEYYIRKR